MAYLACLYYSQVLYGALLGFGEVSGMMPNICLTEYTPRDYRGTAYGIASGMTLM